MTSTFRLGRVFGIEIGVNWTWLFIFVLVTWTLAVNVFPAMNAGLSDTTYWLMATAASVLFFASVLAHELGHALQARRDEVEIEGITLWLLGGVAKFKSLYRTAAAEFRIAVAGPLVTLVIATVLLLAAWLLELPAPVDGVVFWLGYINAAVLVFNLLPALPLDGGRILHSALWRSRGDLGWATDRAAAVGRGFGWFMIGGGIVLVFLGAFIPGIWLVILGWFVNGAAQAEAQQMAVREALGGLRVRDLMAAEPVTVRPDQTLGEFIDDVARNTRFTSYPVVEGDRPVGLLTFRRVADLPRAEWDTRRVGDCMLARDEVPVVDPDEDASEALLMLAGGSVSRALVVVGDRLAGIVSITDVARAAEINGRGRRAA